MVLPSFPQVDGFKAKIIELGYVERQNIVDDEHSTDLDSATDILVAASVQILWIDYKRAQELSLTIPRSLLGMAAEIIREHCTPLPAEWDM